MSKPPELFIKDVLDLRNGLQRLFQDKMNEFEKHTGFTIAGTEIKFTRVTENDGNGGSSIIRVEIPIIIL